MSSEVKERLLKYLHHKHLSQIEFTQSIGVSSTYIGAMRRSISDDKMLRIRERYPDLKPDWLLYGKGDMSLNLGVVPLMRSEQWKSVASRWCR